MIKKNIPNTITSLNLISGCIATYWAFQSNYELALLFIVIGAVFDFFDGMSARLLLVSSEIGKELDSLADDITFGFAPSAIVFSYMSGLCGLNDVRCVPLFYLPIIPLGGFAAVAFVMAAFSAIRLAKFNLDERQTLGFMDCPHRPMPSSGARSSWAAATGLPRCHSSVCSSLAASVSAASCLSLRYRCLP